MHLTLARANAYGRIVRWLDVFESSDLDGAPAVFAENLIVHANIELLPRIPPGIAGLRAVLGFLRDMLPDLKFRFDGKPVGQGQTDVVRWTANGIHGGKLFSVPPTGKPVSFEGRCMATHGDDDKVVALWIDFELQTILNQIGMAPTAPPK